MSGCDARRAGRPDEGMTLVEAVIAALLVGLLSAVVLGVLLQTQSAQMGNRGRVAAANLAARELDIVREEFARDAASTAAVVAGSLVVNGNPLAGGTAGDPLVVDGVPYTVTRSVAWNIGGNGSACDGDHRVQYPTLRVSVSVTWPNMGSIQPVVSEAALAPAKGTHVMSDDAAFIAVKVVDSAGEPNRGRRVTVTGVGANTSTTTDAVGCAVLMVMPQSAGTNYTVSLGEDGFVSPSDNPTPAEQTGIVTRGSLHNHLKLSYDRAVTLRVAVQDTAGNLVDPSWIAPGSIYTLSRHQAAGATGETELPITGNLMDLGEHWPTRYAAYIGSERPAGGVAYLEGHPGTTLDLAISIASADLTVTDLPGEVTSLVIAADQATCLAGAGTAVPIAGGQAGVSMLPATVSLFVSSPWVTCAPGPADLDLPAGTTSIPWALSSLTVVGAPADGALWAVQTAHAPGALTCPAGHDAVALDVSAARGGPVNLPAGEWYLFRTDGPPSGACLGLPQGRFPFTVGYGADELLTWTETAP